MFSLTKRFKSIGILLLLIAILSVWHWQLVVYAIDSAVAILPSPPENALAVNSAPTEITLTWDASPTAPANIASYVVYYKEATEPDYPATPQITRTDLLASYSEVIPVTVGVTYNFIVHVNDINDLLSTEDCASCKATNTVLCGNDMLDAGEACDGIELNGALCTDYGYISGSMSCNTDCTYNYSACYAGGGGGWRRVR